MYQVRTIEAAKAGELSSRQYPNLLSIARQALSAQEPTIEIRSDALEGAIHELAGMESALASKLMLAFAAVR